MPAQGAGGYKGAQVCSLCFKRPVCVLHTLVRALGPQMQNHTLTGVVRHGASDPLPKKEHWIFTHRPHTLFPTEPCYMATHEKMDGEPGSGTESQVPPSLCHCLAQVLQLRMLDDIDESDLCSSVSKAQGGAAAVHTRVNFSFPIPFPDLVQQVGWIQHTHLQEVGHVLIGVRMAQGVDREQLLGRCTYAASGLQNTFGLIGHVHRLYCAPWTAFATLPTTRATCIPGKALHTGDAH